MGLLDFLPQGLLDVLQNSAQNQQMPMGLLSDQANYGPQPAPAASPFSMAGPPPAPQPQAMPQPQAAPRPLSMAGPPPMQSQPPSSATPAAPVAATPRELAPVAPGISNRLALASNGFFGNSGSGPLGMVAGGLGALVTGNPSDPDTIGQQSKIATQKAMISGLQAHGVSNADITAALANPEYLKKILDNSVKEKETVLPATADQRKAAFGGNDNGQPLYINADTGKPTFGPAQTNVNVSTEKTGQAELAKTAVEEYKNAQLASKESQKRLSMYDAFEKASQGFTPGASAEMRLTAQRYLKDAGIIKGDNVPDGEIQQMIGRQLAIHAQPKGQGAVSNYERELYSSALPSMIQSPEGLKQAIAINRKLEQFDMNIAQIWRQSAATNRGIPNYLDVQNKIADLGSPLSPGDMAAIQPGKPAASAPTAAAAPQQAAKPSVVTQGGHTYTLQPDGSYK